MEKEMGYDSQDQFGDGKGKLFLQVLFRLLLGIIKNLIKYHVSHCFEFHDFLIMIVRYTNFKKKI